MDVQADEASVTADPSPTLAVGAPAAAPPGASRAVRQGSFFQDDPYPTFADTDPTPMVPKAAPRRGPASSRGLRIAVVVAALAVAAAGAALALVETGVISTTSNTTGGQSMAPPVTHPTVAPKTQLLAPAGFGAANAAYTVDARAFGLTITTTTGRSWVSVGIVGQKPIFAGIVAANSSQHVTLLGPAQLEIGAGGTTVTVTSGRRTQTLTPPLAPYS
ncbi:MAG TPA: hypothetical protein VIX84_10880, partial [Acidimicrobiales bacterium]